MKNLIPFVIARLTERSSVIAIATLIAGIAGVNLSPENTEVIATAVIGVVSAIAIFVGQDKKPE